MKIYADNAATTRLSRRAEAAYVKTVREFWGNPSSIHASGRAAAVLLADTRERVARCLGCKPSEVYFTSGGTESNTQALLSGALYGKKRGRDHVITTAFEHEATLSTMRRLKKYGFKITYLSVHENGIVDPRELRKAIDKKTALVSVMAANNEIGTLQPISEIGEICRERRVLFHTDAVQIVGHLPMSLDRLDADFLSLSAHKFHGPRGIGALVAKNRVALSSLLSGGGQEMGRRAGTENLAGAVAMAEALEESLENIEKKNAKTLRLRERLVDGLLQIPDSRLNGDRRLRLPGNVNVSFDGVDGEPLVLMLDAMGVEASVGSACHSGSLEPSHVLLALGRSDADAISSLRLTIDESNTVSEVDTIISAVSEAVGKLRAMAE